MTKSQVVVISGFHDYRTAKRASIHQVTDGFFNAGFDASFISIRFSLLSKFNNDSRYFLWDKANCSEVVNDIRCFLWKTWFHPFESRNWFINSLMARLFFFYARLPGREFDKIIRDADHILIEAGFAAILIKRIRKLNNKCKIIYYVTDLAQTVGGHPQIEKIFRRDSHLVDRIYLRSPKMKSHFNWLGDKLYRADFGINSEQYRDVASSPYSAGKMTAVSVGSMLFDHEFIQEAARQFPEVEFHVIGSGMTFDAPANVFIHPEMPFVDTLPYVKHATIGLAAYRLAPGVEYLAESSLKLAQYEFFGLPAVCPRFAVGDVKSRFGYEPNNSENIGSAMRDALAHAGHITPRTFLTWDEVAERIIAPEQFPEIRL